MSDPHTNFLALLIISSCPFKEAPFNGVEEVKANLLVLAQPKCLRFLNFPDVYLFVKKIFLKKDTSNVPVTGILKPFAKN